MALDLGNMNLEERKKYLELKARYGTKIKPWYKKWWGVLILIILGLTIVLTTAAGLYVWNEIQRINKETGYTQNLDAKEALKKAIYGPGTNYFTGSDNAILTIVEFSDFACPYCAQSHGIIKKLINQHPGKIKIIYRDLPLHESSISLSLGARCAGEQGMFWEMHDQIFDNQKSLTGTEEELKSLIYGLAGSLGLNAAAFDSCYQNKKYLSNISNDYTDAKLLNLRGTPSWFLNEKLLSGSVPEADFLNLISNHLNNLQ
jgi:protein-disulfide isomerase